MVAVFIASRSPAMMSEVATPLPAAITRNSRSV
jgi:hypothetical protein